MKARFLTKQQVEIWSLLLVLLVAGAAEAHRSVSAVLVEIDNQRAIIVGDFRDAAARLPAAERRALVTLTGRQQLLARMLEREILVREAPVLGVDQSGAFRAQLDATGRYLLLVIARQRMPETRRMSDEECYAEAVRRKLDMSPEYQRRMADIRRDMLAGEMERALAWTGAIAESELQAYFDQHREQFQQAESVDLRWIFVKLRRRATAAEIAAARERADNAWARVHGGEDWATVARDCSDDTGSVQRGGAVRVQRGSRSGEFQAVAFGLTQPGEISPVFRDRRGLHIVQLVTHNPARPKTFTRVRAEIESLLRARKTAEQRAAFIANWRSRHTVVIHERLLATMWIETR